MARRSLGIFIVTILGLTGAVATAVEEPAYHVVATYPEFEIREYPQYVVAQTEVEAEAGDASSAGFRILAGYIFGGNHTGQKIAMTAPVAQEQAVTSAANDANPGQSLPSYTIQFGMPRGYTLENLPQPDDSRVHLTTIAQRRVAVLRYSGTWSQERFEAHVRELKDALVRNNLRWHGTVVWARYDPPWMPWFLRRNEIWLALD